MKKLIIPVIFFCFTGFLFAIDVIGPVSGTWTAAQSPVNVIGEIELPVNQQLIIEPGVEVNFSGHYKFNIYGRLLAIGEEENYIEFTAADELTGWHGLRFFDTVSNGQDSSKLVYCILEYGNATGISPDYRGGAIYCANSSDLVISNSIIRNSKSLSAGAGLYLDSSDIDINNTVIYGNEATGAGGGIFMLNSSPTLDGVEIYDNSAYYDGGGINCYSSNPVLTYVALWGNSTQWNGGGISAYNNSVINITNATIAENYSPQDGCGIAVLYNSSVNLMNSIIWDNYPYEIYVSNSASLTVDYTNVNGGQAGITSFGTVNWLAGGNLDVDPLFVDPAADDFSLQGNSPCIDAGNPDPAYLDPDGTRNDMGAYNYLQAGIRGLVAVTSGDGNVEDVLINIYEANTDDLVATVNPNAEGVFFITIDAGTYDITAYLAGYFPYPTMHEDVVVYESQLTTGINFNMNLIAQGSIYGIITVEGTGNPENVLITAGEEETYPTYNFVLDIWWYEIFLNPGYYDVTASLINYQDTTRTDVLVQSSQQTSGQNFHMIPISFDGTVTGTVSLLGGTGNLEDVSIQIEGDDDIYHPDEDGFYSITYPGGYHDITASLEGYTSVTLRDVIIVENQTTPGVDFVLINWVPVTGTQYSMSRLVNLTLDGQFICGGMNNQVAAFHTDLENVETCRGIAEWDDNGYWFIHIVSDEQQGEEIYFKIYESYTEEIYTSIGALEFEDCTYSDLVYCFYVPSPERTHTYNLMENWNWTSFNLFPDNYAFSSILEPLTPDDIFQIKTQGSFYTYEYGEWTGELAFLNLQDSYKINMFNAVEGFQYIGTAINPQLYPIILEEEYNWISYIPLKTLPLEQALSDLNWPDSLMIKTQNKSAVHFAEYGGWIGDLEIMEPGVGYILYWPNEIPEGEILFFTYPPNLCYSGPEEEERIFAQQPVSTPIWEVIPGTRFNMIMLAEILDNAGNALDYSNYTIGVFDTDGNCRSIGKSYNDLLYFTIVGNDNNEELQIRLYDHITQEIIYTNYSILFEIDAVIGSPAEPYSTRLNAPENNIPNLFGLEQNHPNPFNPSTFINYTLPADGEVTLEIYNMKGQLIQTIVNEFKNAGRYTIEWNAAEFGSGIYFYKLSSGELTEVRKCLMIK